MTDWIDVARQRYGGGLPDSAAPVDAPAYADPRAQQTNGFDMREVPWWMWLEFGRRGLLKGVKEAVPRAAGSVFSAVSHQVFDRAENAAAGAAVALTGPPAGPRDASRDRLPDRQRIAQRLAATPLAQDPIHVERRGDQLGFAGALPNAIAAAVRGAATNQPPPGLPAEGAFYEYTRRAGVPPVPAMIADAIATEGPLRGMGAISRGVVVPVGKAVGRATEPLRQLPVVQQIGDKASVGFSLRAYNPTKLALPDQGSALPLWMRQLGKDLTDPRYRDYILGRIPESQRDAIRQALRRGGGAAALHEAFRRAVEPSFNYVVGSFTRRYGLSREDAADLVRELGEESTRNPSFVQGVANANERQAIDDLRRFFDWEQQAGARVGARETELHARIERWARISNRLNDQWLAHNEQLARIQEDVNAARTRLERAQHGGIPLPTQVPTMGQEAYDTWRQTGVMPVAGATQQRLIDALTTQLQDAERRFGSAKLVNQDLYEKLQGSLRRYGELTWHDMPVVQTPQGPRMLPLRSMKGKPMPEIDRQAALSIVNNRRELLVDYWPRSRTPRGARFLGSEGAGVGARAKGDLATGLGAGRVTNPQKTTYQLEREMSADRAWKEFTDPTKPIGEELQDTFHALTGRPPKPSVWNHALDDWERHGVNRERAIGHLTAIREILAKASSKTAKPGWIPLGRGAGEESSRDALRGLFSGFDDDTQAALRKRYVSPDVYRFLTQIQAPEAANAYRGLPYVLSAVNAVYRPIVTLVRPEFWERNGAWSIYRQAGGGNVNPRNYIDGAVLSFSKELGGRAPQTIDLGPRYGVVPLERARQLLIRHRVLGGGQSELLKGGIMRPLGSRYQQIEDGLRASWALYELRAGKTLAETSKSVQRIMFDYGPEALTSIERTWRDLAAPFWTWTRNIYRLTSRDVFERPELIARPAQIQDIGFREANMDPELESALRSSPFNQERFGFPTSVDTERNALTMANLGFIGHTDVGAGASFRPGRTNSVIGPFLSQLEYLVSNMGPVGSLAYSAATGREAYSHGRIRSEQELPSWMHGFPGTRDVAGYPVGPAPLDLLGNTMGQVPSVPGSLLSPDLSRQEQLRKYFFGDPRRTGPLDEELTRQAAGEKGFWSTYRGTMADRGILEGKLESRREFENRMRGRGPAPPAPAPTPTRADTTDWLDKARQRYGR